MKVGGVTKLPEEPYRGERKSQKLREIYVDYIKYIR